MTQDEQKFTREHWKRIQEAAASSGYAVLSTNKLPEDGRLALSPEMRQSLAEAVARNAMGHLQRGATEKAESFCRTALMLHKQCQPAQACELTLLRIKGKRNCRDDIREVEIGARDPFVVGFSYSIAVEATAASLEAINRSSHSTEHAITVDVLLAGFFYWQATNIHTDASSPLTNLATMLTNMDAIIGSEEVKLRALALNPHDAHAHHNLALGYHRARRFGDALKSMRQASVEGHHQANQKITQLQEDIRTLEKQLQDCGSPEDKAIVLYYLGRYKESYKLLSHHSVRLTSETAFYTAHCLRAMGRFEEAARAFETMAATGAGVIRKVWAAACYKRCGQLVSAVKMAKQIVREDPLLADAYYLLADSYRLLGEPAQEKSAVQALFKLDKVLRLESVQ
jgi:tetratricopeptide (TPR) repeat protein